MRFDAMQIAECTRGRFLVEPFDACSSVTAFTWDSRAVAPGTLYVALPGERVDGHSFVASAIAAGARAVLVSKDPGEEARTAAEEAGAAVILVPDVREAITDLARAWRLRLDATVIALTGSTGKTTTKNLVRDVLARSFRVAATQGNQNNELGVPNTILQATESCEALVVEMGMRGSGQIAGLCEFVRPHWGIISNVGDAHVELLGSRDAIAAAKTELFCGLEPGGIAFANAVDEYCVYSCTSARLAERGVETILFGGSQDVAARLGLPGVARSVWAEDVVLDETGRPSFTLCARGFDDGAAAVPVAAESESPVPAAPVVPVVRRVPCTMELRGLHNVSNACAAAAVGLAMGMDAREVASALADAQPEGGRQQILRAPAGFTVVDDTYNANPDSMRASLSMFRAMDVEGRRVAVLGDMLELGSFARELHAGIGAFAAQLGIDRLVCLGENARHIACAAREGGMDRACIVEAEDVDDVVRVLQELLTPADAVLLKASNGMNLKLVVERLVG